MATDLAMSIVIATMTVMGLPTDDRDYLAEIYCGAENIYHESRGQPDLGMIAVAQVVRNRVKDPRYPNTVCDVIYQDNQFSWVNDGISNYPKLNNTIERESFIKSAWVHIIASDHEDITNGATHYHNINIKPSWSWPMTITAIIKDHIFYTDK
jgi:N-acetylmuramoyl-L-alanine amidase